VSRSRVRWLLVVAGTLLWVLAIYPAYYVVHKPLTAGEFLALASVAADLLTWLAMLTVATALGSRLTRRLAYHSLLERLVFSAGLGLMGLSLLTFGLALAGLLYGWLFWLLLLGGGTLLWREFLDLGRSLRQARWPRPRGRWATFLSLFIAAILVLSAPIALTPPTSWDSLLYHLVGPERYLQAHHFTIDFDNYLLFAPAFGEMLFTAAMGLRSDVVPRLIHFGYLLLTLGALGAFAARHWKPRMGLVAIALFLSFPTAVRISTRAYVDFSLAFYSFAALYALLNWLSQSAPDGGRDQPGTGAWGWLVVAGLFSGAAASVKYNGAMAPFILGTVLTWALLRKRLPTRRFLSGAVVLAGLTLAVAAPWYVKNIVATGNPIYPMAWGGRGWNEITERWLQPAGPKASLWEVVILPWRLTVLGQEGTVAYDATLSPLFLTLLPLLLVVRRPAAALGELLLAVAMGYAFWIANGLIATGGLFLNGRWLVPVAVPLSLLCAYSLHGLRDWDLKTFSLRRILMMLTTLTLVFALLSQLLLTVGLNPWPYLLGQQSRDENLNTYVSQRFHQTVTYLNQNLTAQDRVLFIWEPRSYGCQVPHRADVLLDNFSQSLARYGSPEGVLHGLRGEGFTHVLVNEYIYPWILRDFPITPEEQAGWESFAARYLTNETLVHAEGDYLRLYRLPAASGPESW
jgi:hypothetical protein